MDDSLSFALRASEDRFRALAENVPSLIWTSTPQKRCDYVNPQFTVALKGGRLQNRHGLLCRTGAPAKLSQCLRPQRQFETTTTCRNGIGTIFPLIIRPSQVSPLSVALDRMAVTGIVGRLSDVDLTAVQNSTRPAAAGSA